MLDNKKDVKIGRWIPLESNPEVMNSWSFNLGLSPQVNEFCDIYGLDPVLLDMVPKPVKAIIMVFPLTEKLEELRRDEDGRIAKDGQHKLDPGVVFIKQTIPNACGTIALLHAFANAGVEIDPASPLENFFQEIASLSPSERAKALEETTLFAEAHVAAASLGQSAAPSADEVVDLHFITFVQVPSAVTPDERRLVELDGRRIEPIDLGKSEDLLKDVAHIVRQKYIANSTSQNFGLLALGPSDRL